MLTKSQSIILFSKLWLSSHLQESGKQKTEFLCVWFQGFRNLLKPTLCERGEAQNAGLQIDHTTSRHCGRGRHRQVLHFKHNGHHLQEEDTWHINIHTGQNTHTHAHTRGQNMSNVSLHQ